MNNNNTFYNIFQYIKLRGIMAANYDFFFYKFIKNKNTLII